MTSPEGVVKAAHYNSHPSGVEVRQVTDHMLFNVGNAFKYVLRRNDKGTALKDLYKAVEYLRFQSEIVDAPKLFNPSAHNALVQLIAGEPSAIVRVILHALWSYTVGSVKTDRNDYLNIAREAILDLMWHEYDHQPEGTARQRPGRPHEVLPPA